MAKTLVINLLVNIKMHQNHSNWVHGQIWDTPTFKTTVMWEYKHALFAEPPLAQFFASLERGTKPSEKLRQFTAVQAFV